MGIDNRFLRTGFEDRIDPPQRWFGLLDQAEDDRVLFDCIEATFFENLREPPRGMSAWALLAEEAPIFVIEIERGEAASFVDWIRALGVTSDDDAEPLWIEFWLQPGQHQATLYANLYAAGQPIVITGRVAEPATAAALTGAFSLDDHSSDEASIAAALGNLTRTVDWVGVYDVGQGGANGLCNAGSEPLAYFDFGGGVLANATTFPTATLTEFCYLHDPPVVLSHWDWDHWSSGNRFPAAQSLVWIVPHQVLGAVHATFAAKVAGGLKLLVWPAGLSQVTVGQATIRACTGSGRNHSGLALEVAGPAGEPPILLTGDARYTAVPGAVTGDFTALVAPHHGADMKSHATPAGKSHVGARVAYSFGLPNTFGHPRAVTEVDHHGRGWPHASQGAAAGIERHTALPALRGHIGLGWSVTPSPPLHLCGQLLCALKLIQV